MRTMVPPAHGNGGVSELFMSVMYVAEEALHQMFNEQSLKDAVLLVLANKQDLADARKGAEIAEKLSLDKLNGSHVWKVHETCALEGRGIEDGLAWLADVLTKRARKGDLG